VVRSLLDRLTCGESPTNLLSDTEGASIYSGEKQVGKVTSGIPSPSLGKNIAMGYIENAFSKKGKDVEVEVRGKRRPAQIVKMPFVETKYYRG
jgi:aminomethyltransferase